MNFFFFFFFHRFLFTSLVIPMYVKIEIFFYFVS